MFFETLESRKLLSAVVTSTTIHEVAGKAFTVDLGKDLPQVVENIKPVATKTAVLTLHADIHWGDGTTSMGTVVSKGDGTFEIDGTHIYSTTGRYHIVIFSDEYYTGSGPHPQFVIAYQTIHDTAEVSAGS